ncbi:phosphotransferase [Gracilimonas sp.]|uniref:phosphotransferase n=1 Tax=Gracilimonas sp. TaxID=1974203 RepID=UPI0028712208|nr:phosphotransferase [Gracilimonas sp.]
MSEFSKEKLLQILEENIPEISLTGEIEKLSGGNINVVWRAKGEHKNVIIKYAPPHIATNPDVPLSNSRIDFEANALKLYNDSERLKDIASSKIRPPELYFFDGERSLIVMEDVGDLQELSSGVLASGSPQKIGERLGIFIGDLHRITFRDEAFGRDFHNLEIQKVRNQLQYQPAWEYAGLDNEKLEEEIKKRSQDLGNSLLEKGKCLVMGDLWPPSIFVGKRNQIRLIDWEFVHFGRPLQDVAHFAAHCWMQGQVEKSTYYGSAWENLWTSFLKGYKVSTSSLYGELLNKRELEDIGVHIGAEILIRTFGSFKNGYLYESYEIDHELLQGAKEQALRFILDAEAIRREFGF